MRPLLLLLLACNGAPADKGDGAPWNGNSEEDVDSAEPLDPTEWTYVPDEEIQHQYDRALVESALAEVYALLPSLHAGPVLEAYADAMDSSDPACPDRYETDGNVFWYAACESASGMYYSGYAFDYQYEDVDLNGDGTLWDASVVSGSATLSQDSDYLHISGNAYLANAVQEGVDVGQSQVFGWMEVWGPRWTGLGWLGSGLAPSIGMYSYHLPNESGESARYLYAEGTLGGMDPGIPGIELTLAIGNEEVGFPCSVEPAGSVAIRDTSGAWWEVVFDVNIETWRSTGACDGCGTVFYQGEAVGEACADPTALLDWERAPW